MPTTELRPERRHRPAAAVQPSQGRFRTRWAIAMTGLVGLLFTGLTATTVALWTTDPTYDQTNPVVDLAFFALGGILLTAGLASQICSTPTIAGLQQAIVTLVCLAAAGLLGGRIEPTIGPLVLLAAIAPLAALHPARRRLLAAGAEMSRSMMALAGVAAVPATRYAADLLTGARAAGPSCFLGQCVQGDRYAEAAALAIAIVLVALLAAARTPGWKLPATCAGFGAVVLGVASLVFPAEVGALSTLWAVVTVAWGTALPVIAHLQPEPDAQR
jgi:hypothetical protein